MDAGPGWPLHLSIDDANLLNLLPGMKNSQHFLDIYRYLDTGLSWRHIYTDIVHRYTQISKCSRGELVEGLQLWPCHLRHPYLP